MTSPSPEQLQQWCADAGYGCTRRPGEPTTFDVWADDARGTVRLPTSEREPATFVARFPGGGISPGALAAAVDARPGLVEAVVDGAEVEVTVSVFPDALDRQSCLVALAEWGKIRRVLGAAGPTSEPAAAAAAEPATTAAAATTSSAASTGWAAPSAAAQPAAAWAPTHQVPPEGMAAWNAPDPSLVPVAQLAPRLPLRVADVRGAWAQVVAENGWTGWVDHRRLLPLS